MLTKEKIEAFDKLLQETNPDADKSLLVRARNCFMRYYGYYNVAPEIALAIATEGELMLIRNAGKKCQKIYANAQASVRATFANPIRDILELKNAVYAALYQKGKYVSDVDKLILLCVEHKIRSKKQFDLLMPYMLAYRMEWTFGFDQDMLRKVYCAIARRMHPEVKDPHAYIVRYVDEDREITYVGVDPGQGQKSLVHKIINAGYNVNVSGKINGMPIHFINAEKKEEELHGKADSDV